MREVILTVGPRAAGKSTFCKGVLALDPSIKMVSRDEILVELFGTTSLSPYTGQHQYGREVLWKKTEDLLTQDENVKLILDMWNENFWTRQEIIRKLRRLGADRVVAWFFTTSFEQVCEWFWLKPDSKDYGPDAPGWGYGIFHEFAMDINFDGFDEIVRIDPLTTGPEHVLKLQTNLQF